MTRFSLIVVGVFLADCHLVLPFEGAQLDARTGDLPDTVNGDQRDPDLQDASSVADPLTPFTKVAPVLFSQQRPGHECDPSLTADERTLYFGADTGTSTPLTVQRVTRGSRTDLWGGIQQITFSGATKKEIQTPHISLDGVHMWLVYLDKGHQIFRSTNSGNTIFGQPQGALITFDEDKNTGSNPSISGDQLLLVFTRHINNQHDLMLASRSSTATSFSKGEELEELNTTADEFSPWINHDGTVVYFTRTVKGQHDIFVATRSSTKQPFGKSTALGSINSPTTNEEAPWLSPDLRRIYFCRQVQLFMGER